MTDMGTPDGYARARAERREAAAARRARIGLAPLPDAACPCGRWVGHNDGCEFLLHNRDGSPFEKPVVDLFQVSNRAEHVIGATRRALREAGASREYVRKIVREQMSGDYNNVLLVAMRELDWEDPCDPS